MGKKKWGCISRSCKPGRRIYLNLGHIKNHKTGEGISRLDQQRPLFFKSPLFLAIIFAGYISGICAHFGREFSPVVFLYGLNATMVAIDLWLVLHFRRHPGKLPMMDQAIRVILSAQPKMD